MATQNQAAAVVDCVLGPGLATDVKGVDMICSAVKLLHQSHGMLHPDVVQPNMYARHSRTEN